MYFLVSLKKERIDEREAELEEHDEVNHEANSRLN